MSRSYKHTAIFKQYNVPYYKRLSNKRIRKFLCNLEDGFKSTKIFRIVLDPYNICDWKYFPRDKQSKTKAKRK
jgi:hypothetical protein